MLPPFLTLVGKDCRQEVVFQSQANGCRQCLLIIWKYFNSIRERGKTHFRSVTFSSMTLILLNVEALFLHTQDLVKYVKKKFPYC